MSKWTQLLLSEVSLQGKYSNFWIPIYFLLLGISFSTQGVHL